ncbi:hypothetical protein ABEX55_19985 [Priestia endophytica]|uniref:hypothetical protein n=1 Tax=Priestia endophytica TaxID=135735 RepID=UPI003D29315B
MATTELTNKQEQQLNEGISHLSFTDEQQSIINAKKQTPLEHRESHGTIQPATKLAVDKKELLEAVGNTVKQLPDALSSAFDRDSFVNTVEEHVEEYETVGDVLSAAVKKQHVSEDEEKQALALDYIAFSLPL